VPRRAGFAALRTAFVWALVLFHVALFTRRLAEPGSLDAPAALRWAGTLAIFAAAFLLRVRAARLTQRQLLALALAAVALHAPMLQGAVEAERAAGFWSALPTLLAPALALCALLALAGEPDAVGGALARAESVPERSAPSRTPFSPRPP